MVKLSGKVVCRQTKTTNDVVYAPATDDVGCFVKGTTLLKGTYEGIEVSSVIPYTTYLGGGGVCGESSTEPVHYTTKTDKLIYGFNGEEPFFTADHPFATQDGWRAIDPHAAKKISPWLQVGPLEVGDYVKRISHKMGPSGFEYSQKKITKISTRTLEAGSTLYGLHTFEGPKSYHANGYLVHMNYPEITSANVQQSLSKVFKSDAHAIIKNIIEPLITDMHGERGETFLQNIKSGLETKLSSKQRFIPLEETMLLDMPLAYETEKGEAFPTHISIRRGEVFLNNQHVQSAVVSEHQICWTRQVNGRLQHGNIHFNPNRMTAYGRISTDEEPVTSYAAAARISVVQQNAVKPSVKFTATLPVNTYNCLVGETKVKGGPMTDWGTVIMGYEVDPKTKKMGPVGKASLANSIISTPDDLDNGVIFSVDSDTQALKVSISVPSAYCDLPDGPKYITMEGTFNWDFSSFKGTAIKYDSTATGFEGDSYEWTGLINRTAASKRIIQQSRTASILMQSTRSVSSAAAEVHPDSYALASSTAAEDLTLEELYQLPAPDQSEVHDLSFDLIKQMMEHQIPAKWREEILGISKPDIGNLEVFASKHSDFLANEFGLSYIGFALSKNATYGKKYSTTDKNKMLYYWAGDKDSSLSHSSDYSRVNTVVATNAFIKVSEKLQKYMKSNPTKWAYKLFHKFDDPVFMNGFVRSLDAAQSTNLLQKQSMVLQCLAPDINYGTQLYHKVMVQRLSNIGKTYKGSSETFAILKEFIYDACGQMITAILSGSDKLDSGISKQLQKLIRESQKEANEIQGEDYQTFLLGIVTETITLWSKESGVPMKRMSNAVSKVLKLHPEISSSAFGKVVGFITPLLMWAFMAYSIVNVFMNWGAMAPEQKLLAVANGVSFALSTFGKFPDLFAKFQEAKDGFFDFDFVKKFMKLTAADSTKAAEDDYMTKLIEDVEDVSTVEEVITIEAEQAGKNAGSVESEVETTSRFEKVCNVTGQVAKVFNIIALAAAVVAMGFQIARDFREGQSIAVKALDITEAVVFGLQVLAETAAMVFENAVLSTMGSALAIAGIVIFVILQIIGRKPPKPKPTEADIFINESVKPFLESLPEPDQAWLDTYHGRTKKS